MYRDNALSNEKKTSTIASVYIDTIKFFLTLKNIFTLKTLIVLTTLNNIYIYCLHCDVISLQTHCWARPSSFLSTIYSFM